MNKFKSNQKEDIELENLLDSLSAEASSMDLKFKSKLKFKLRNNYNKKSERKYFSSALITILAFKKALLFSGALSIVAVVGVSSFLLSSSTKKVIKDTFAENEIVAKVKAANVNSDPINPSQIEEDIKNGNLSNSDNFVKLVMKSKTGPRTVECKTSNLTSYMPKNSEFYIYEANGQSYSKSINRDNNGNIESYSLLTPTEMYFLSPGESKVTKIKNDPSTTQSSFFEGMAGMDHSYSRIPDEASFNGEEVIDGVSYYTITFEISLPCDYMNSAAGKYKAISKMYIQKNSYKIAGSAEYIGSVSEENLVESYFSSYELSYKTIDEAIPFFVYDLGLPLNDLTYIPTFTEYTPAPTSYPSGTSMFCDMSYEEYKQLMLSYDTTGTMANTPDFETYLRQAFNDAKASCGQ